MTSLVVQFKRVSNLKTGTVLGGQVTVDSLGSNGAVSMSLIESNSTTYVKGFVSDDGNNMVLRIYEEGTTERLIGIILAVKQ